MTPDPPKLAERTKELRDFYAKSAREKGQLQKDLVVAFDRIAKLERTVDRQSIELWVYRLVTVGAGGLIALLWTSLSNCWQALK